MEVRNGIFLFLQFENGSREKGGLGWRVFRCYTDMG